jgi:hypothetical protein
VTSINPFNSPGKRAVRELWNSPLLRYMNSTYRFRYRYMGLPGVDLLDIRLWRDIIDEVIAFELPAKPTNQDRQGRRNIVKLRRNLQLLGIPGRAFYGPIEEVVTLGKDYDGAPYKQDKVITLYNLDFCNEIGSRIETREQGKQRWRFEAIRQILRDQRQCYSVTQESCYFIILITVRDQIDAGQLRSYLSSNPYSDTSDYIEECGSSVSLPSSGYVLGTHSWALKAFLHNMLRQYLTNPHIPAVFFPLVKYMGTPVRTWDEELLESPMLHYMILCKFCDLQEPSPAFWPSNFLVGVTSVRAGQDSSLIWDPEPGEPLICTTAPNPIDWFNKIEARFLKGI